MKDHFSLLIILTLLFAYILTPSCEPEYVQAGNSLKFSTDTLKLDTLVVGRSSATSSQLKLYNVGKSNSQNIRLSLAGGDQSPYSINVNGMTGTYFEALRLRSKDSLFVFVQVKPGTYSAGHEPVFNLEDSIIVENGVCRLKAVLTTAMINAKPLEGELKEFEWSKNQSIYVKKDVVVPVGETLMIQEGCHVYFNNNTSLIVEGTLKARGDYKNPVIFSGVRQGNIIEGVGHDQVPGVWDQIWLKESAGENVLNNCEIRGAKTGIKVGGVNASLVSKLVLTNSLLDYSSKCNLLSYNSDVTIANCVFSSAPQQLIVHGGKLAVYQSTLYNYYEYENNFNEPAVVVSSCNYLDVNDDTEYLVQSCLFYNTIVTGSNSDEVDLLEYPLPENRYVFTNCILRTKKLQQLSNAKNNLYNVKPAFRSEERYHFDFHLKEESPAIDAGDPGKVSQFPCDKGGVSRSHLPDIGAYEFCVSADE
ncbi:hypothetical protein DMA11_04720 [Marinilabiliaceae bacterium JC017]|nr:hypothetical protein DMA11_04720 [Marinilabiliaceae bacterium JC017]